MRGLCNGSCRGITTSANACSLASLRALCLVVGSLPSRALVQMSLRGNTSPPLIMLVNGLQLVCLLQVDELRRNVKICHTERSHRRSRVKFPRRNGGNVADFQATKGVRCACEQSRGSALVKWAPKCRNRFMGSCRGITLRANACSLASLRALKYNGR